MCSHDFEIYSSPFWCLGRSLAQFSLSLTRFDLLTFELCGPILPSFGRPILTWPIWTCFVSHRHTPKLEDKRVQKDHVEIVLSFLCAFLISAGQHPCRTKSLFSCLKVFHSNLSRPVDFEHKSGPIFGKGMRRSPFQRKKGFFQWKGGRQFSESGVW